MAGFPSLTDVKYYTILFFKTNGFRSSLEIPEVHHELDNFITHLAIKSRTWERRDEFHVKVRSSQVTSMRSMAVLSGALLSPPQSLCGFSTLARLYYFARPTKTAMLRRLASYEFLKLTSTSKLLLKLNCIFITVDLPNWIETFKDKMDDKSYQLIFEIVDRRSSQLRHFEFCRIILWLRCSRFLIWHLRVSDQPSVIWPQ